MNWDHAELQIYCDKRCTSTKLNKCANLLLMGHLCDDRNLKQHLNIAEYIQTIFIYVQVKIYSQHANQKVFVLRYFLCSEIIKKLVGVLLPSLIEHQYNGSYVNIFIQIHTYIRIYYSQLSFVKFRKIYNNFTAQVKLSLFNNNLFNKTKHKKIRTFILPLNIYSTGLKLLIMTNIAVKTHLNKNL